MPASSRPSLLGVPVDPLTMDETVARCRDLIASGRPAHQVSLNAWKVVLMQQQPRLKEIVSGCELVSPDGQSIVWAGKVLGVTIPERVAGIDLMGRLLASAEREGWPVYFLGAREEVLADFEREAMRRHPRLAVAGRHHGYFRDDDDMAGRIARSGARLLLVGMPSPRKEFFLADRLPDMGPLFAMGVGGSFDVWAGRTRRAPAWMRGAGLEWFYRLMLEPRRMWRRYLVGNLLFARLVIDERRRAARGARPEDTGPSGNRPDPRVE